MSTLKVDDIQSRQSTDDAISLASDSSVSLKHSASAKLTTTSSGVSVTGTCTATTFSGSGASLTSLPAANITGTLPAIDGSALTGLSAGGGAYDFVSKTTVSSSVSQVDFNPTGGLSAGQYKLVGKKVLKSHYDGEIEIAPFVNGGTSIVYSGWRYILHKYGSAQGYAQPMTQFVNYNRVTFDPAYQEYIDSSNIGHETFEMEFSTDYNSWFKATSVGTGSQQEYVDVYGHLSKDNFPYASNKLTGLRFTLTNSRTIDAGSVFILFKLKES
jgi:hypothetical protein